MVEGKCLECGRTFKIEEFKRDTDFIQCVCKFIGLVRDMKKLFLQKKIKLALN